MGGVGAVWGVLRVLRESSLGFWGGLNGLGFGARDLIAQHEWVKGGTETLAVLGLYYRE